MKPLAITGFGSVTCYGPHAGLLPLTLMQPEAITAWHTESLHRAWQVPAFNPAEIIPGAKIRRLDRFSCWALVAATLALRDAGLQSEAVDHTRVAVVCATGFGCLELTEAFYLSAAENGWNSTDPILFPETLTNAPAGHIALFHRFQGPNLTLGGRNFGAESALIHAASLLRNQQADIAVVVSGDILMRALYEWYEEAGVLSSACFHADIPASVKDFVPGEGVVATVLEADPREDSHVYAFFKNGRWASRGSLAGCLQSLLPNQTIDLILAAGGEQLHPEQSDSPLHRLVNSKTRCLLPNPIACGLAEAGGLLHLLMALSQNPGPGTALQLGYTAHGDYAALHLEICI